MWKLLPTVLLLLIVCYTDVQAETTQVTSVTCVDTSNSPETGDITTVCTTTVVTTVTTPESTTTTTTVAENLTSSGDILENSDFKHASNNNYGADGWTITNNPGYHNSAGTTGGDSTGGVVASGHNTNISQTVTSVKSETNMSDAEIKHGFRSTLSAKLWFWNNHTNKITLKQTITDNDGNTTTQTRILTDTGCGYTNCGVWEDFDDTYIQGSNSATDFSIKAEVNNVKVTGSTGGHWGPDIDSIELNIQHNEITTTTETVAATSSSSTATSSATTYEYCWQKNPSTCAGDQPGVDDIEEDIVEAVNDIQAEVITEEVTVINVTNLDVEELVIVNVTMDEAIDMELSVDPEQTFEEAFNSIIEEAGMEEEFEDALEDEGLTEEEFFNEVEDIMEEEMGSTEIEPEVETESEVETETEPEVETEPTIEDEEVMNTAGSEETMETEEEIETETEVETEEEVETETETSTDDTTDSEVEEPSETGDSEVEESDEVEVDEVEAEAQVEEIQAAIERVIARIEANLTRIDLKLKATSFVLAKAMQDQQPDMTEYTTQSFYDPTQMPDNRDWYAEDTILDAYGRSIYQDVDLGEYTANDQLARHEEEINTVNNNIRRLEAELEELENGLNE